MTTLRVALIFCFAFGCSSSNNNNVTLTPDARPGADAPATTIDANTGGTPDAGFSFTDADLSDANLTLPDGSAGISCGGLNCSMPTEECCTMLNGTMIDYSCVAPNTCTGAPLTCDGPEDCSNGDVCCAQQQGIECSPTCGGLVVCSNSNNCNQGETCCPFQGLSICSQFGCF